MAEDPRFLLHFKTLTKFKEKLGDGTISENRHLCFIKDAGLIWCRGKYYADSSKIDNISSLYNGWSITQNNGSTITITLTGKQWNSESRTWKDISKSLEIAAATGTVAGLMSASDKTKVDRVTGSNYSISQASETATDRTIKIQGINPSNNQIVSSQVVVPSATQSLAGLLSASDKTKLDELPGSITEGNVNSASKLETARNINGTPFDGTQDITTASWGTSRNINIASSDGSGAGGNVAVNGSANVTLKLPETIKATVQGNATTAATLQTARTINGTSFNGSANITTANWGTARNLTIGNSKKSVNGSADVSWSLSEIGAAASSHTHPISQISDLNSGWDSILAAAPTSYVTRWPSISEVTGKQNLVVQLNGGTSEGTNQFTYNGTGTKTVNITPSVIGAYNLTSQNVSSLANIPATTQVVIAKISTSQTLTFTSIPSANREIHVLIRNTGSSTITVTLSSSYIIGGDSSFTIDAGKYGEVNCMIIGSEIYVRGIGS